MPQVSEDRHLQEPLLVGDFGGTKTNLSLFAGDLSNLRLIRYKSYPTQDAASPIHLIEQFLQEETDATIQEACFGVAAPVVEGVAQTINLPWVIEAEMLLAHFGFKKLHLINDLVATAAAIPHLKPEQFLSIGTAESPSSPGNIGLLAAGTGLGEAFLFWDGRDYFPTPSEGGHKDFAPQTEIQFELHRFLAEIYGHVSVERVVSGPGLVDLYRFLRQHGGVPEPEWLQERFREMDDARVISQAAMAREDEVCRNALSLFLEVYGAEAGNLALQGLTTGGVYIGGGIAPKIKDAFPASPFISAFTAKGRMEPLLSRIPVRLITDAHAPLWGAAVYSRKAAGS